MSFKRKGSVITVLLLLAAVAGLTVAGCSMEQKLQPSVKALDQTEEPFEGMKVNFLGVSTGEASLIQFPDGFTVLVDTGGAEPEEGGDEQGETQDEVQQKGKPILQILNEMNVKKIDLLILTNDMEGHIGGIESIVNNIPVAKVVVPQLLHDVIVNPQWFEGIEIMDVVEGDVIKLPLQAQIRILSPSEPLSLSPQANSLVFMLRHKELRFLFTSDINDKMELKLKDKYNVYAQILKVSDGGSIQASHSEFLREVDAQVAIVFNDTGEGSGREEVLERLNETWIEVYQTRIHGTVTILSTGDDYQIVKEESQ